GQVCGDAPHRDARVPPPGAGRGPRPHHLRAAPRSRPLGRARAAGRAWHPLGRGARPQRSALHRPGRGRRGRDPQQRLGVSLPSRPAPAFIARWDLDKTYLRTDFDTVRDLVRTAVERPDQKRTVPGAATLMRELGRAGAEVHILSGSPEQLRSRIEQKLRLDGARWASLTLKPNLTNILRLRFRALPGQLGYKLPALLRRRRELVCQPAASGALV